MPEWNAARPPPAGEADYDIDVVPPGAVRPDKFEVSYAVSNPGTGELVHDVSTSFKNFAGGRSTGCRTARFRIVNTSEREAMSTDLIGALIANLKRTNDSWESLAMVLEFSDGELSSTSGHLYLPGGAVIPTSARPSLVEEAAAAYLNGYYQPGDALPVKLLVQFDRAKGKYEVTFEDTDVTRWQVTPDNMEAVREELRPDFT